MTHTARALQSHDLSGEGINLWIIYILFWPHKDMMSDQPNAGDTSETAQTWKTIHTKHTLSHPNKSNMEWWLRRPNDIRGPWGPKVSWHLSYGWGKTPKKTSPRKPVPTGDRTRARCVTSAHATTCSTAVDTYKILRNYFNKLQRIFVRKTENQKILMAKRPEMLCLLSRLLTCRFWSNVCRTPVMQFEVNLRPLTGIVSSYFDLVMLVLLHMRTLWLSAYSRNYYWKEVSIALTTFLCPLNRAK